MTTHESCHHGEATACPEYYQLSRRRFMAVSGSAAAIIAAAPAWLPRVALAKDHRGTMRDVIVSIFLRGAADGMSIVVPYAENAYYSNRPTLAVPRPDSGLPNAALDIGPGGNGFFGFHPLMQPLMPAYNNGHLLAVHATGSTDPSRSHFDAQRFMEVGTPDDPFLRTGWLGRHLLTSAPSDPNSLLRAVGISTGLQLALQGGPLTLPIPNLDSYGLTGTPATLAARQAALDSLYDNAGGPLGTIANNTLATIDLLNTIDFASYVPAGGAAYPTGSLGTALKSVAALIKAQVGVEAVAIDVSGWDTHANQGALSGALASLIGTLAASMGAFYTDMISDPSPTGFLVEVQSEFGRRLLENGTLGTDHGHGNMMLLLGQCVAGGRVLSHWPGLAPEQLFEGRDLSVTIDYRSILAEIVQQRLGNPNLDFIFPGFTPSFESAVAC
ncbi:MAG: DUF1501 domain-containing protein [Phycisphaerales bacterium]